LEIKSTRLIFLRSSLKFKLYPMTRVIKIAKGSFFHRLVRRYHNKLIQEILLLLKIIFTSRHPFYQKLHNQLNNPSSSISISISSSCSNNNSNSNNNRSNQLINKTLLVLIRIISQVVKYRCLNKILYHSRHTMKKR